MTETVHPYDQAVAETLCRLGGETDLAVRRAVEVLAAHTRDGSVTVAVEVLTAEVGNTDLLERLHRSPLVGGPNESFRPVVVTENRVYLRAAYETECAVAEGLLSRAHGVEFGEPNLFGGLEPDQAEAVLNGVARRLSVITGGPGTGKTWTVVRLLGALIADNPRLEIRLMAPTGKAASRLAEAVRQGRTELPPEIAAVIPTTATTLHKALNLGGPRAAERPVGADVVVVDEVSMAGLALIRTLLDRLPPTTRLVLCGDPEQLPPIDAGDVLEPLVRASACPTSPLAGCAVRLTRNRRVGVPALARLANAIRLGDGDETMAALREGGANVLVADAVPLTSAGTDLRALIRERYGRLPADGPESSFDVLRRFRILCAHRTGPYGVERFNGIVERELATMDLRPFSRWYAGRPIMVTVNNHGLGLHNGDVGIVHRGEDGIRVWFPAENGYRDLAPARIPPHETVFAMTVHKTQGSEFEEVAIVLPEPDSPLLTREWLYTAVTRAKQRVVVLGSEASVRAAVTQPTARASGLAEALMAPDPAWMGASK